VIGRVLVRRFRGIREGLLEGLKQVTILIGRNGAGKSSVLEVLYLASACAAPRDEVRGVDKLDYIVNRRGGRGSWDGSRGFLWYMGETEAPIEVQIDVKGRTLRFVAVDSPKGLTKPQYPVRLVTEDGRLVELEAGYASGSAEDIRAGRGVPIGIDGELAEVKRFLEGFLLVDGVLIRRPAAVESYAWPRLLVKRFDKHVVEMLREELEPEAEGLTYAPSGEGYHLMLQTPRTAVRVDDLGDGVRSALLAAMLVLAYRPTVLLVEEPELHMHPAGLYTYMKFLTRLAKEWGLQIIATTHSIELIQIAQALSRELGVELAVFYLEREDGVLRARSFTPEDVEALRKLGIDVRLLHKF